MAEVLSMDHQLAPWMDRHFMWFIDGTLHSVTQCQYRTIMSDGFTMLKLLLQYLHIILLIMCNRYRLSRTVNLIMYVCQGFNFQLLFSILKGVRYVRWNSEDTERVLWNGSKLWRWFKCNVSWISSSESYIEKTLTQEELFCNTGPNCLRRKLNRLPLLTNLHLKKLGKKN
jgi:hypothetical protein